MIKVLLVAATHAEAAFLSGSVKKARTGILFPINSPGNLRVELLITGAGITATSYHLAKAITGNHFDLAINIGICGSLDPGIKPVRVVHIISDRFGDFGAEDGTGSLDIFDLGLSGKNDRPYKNGKLVASFNGKQSTLKALPKVNAITVQKSHGSASGCRKAFQKFGPVMESMEGAAFLYVCLMENIPCLQIRSVSNKVERRNKSKWKIPEAIDALAGVTGLLLMELENSGDL